MSSRVLAVRLSALSMSPTGHLHITAGDPALRTAFAQGSGVGLLACMTVPADQRSGLLWDFWSTLATRYVRELCLLSTFSAVPFPRTDILSALVLSVPPMQGAEYVSVDSLCSIWDNMNTAVAQQCAALDNGLAGWLKKHGGAWNQVGRVCLHIAENPRDNERPFAFMATYAPSMASNGQAQHKPLGAALTEYAGASNKAALRRLLEPLQQASQHSSVLRDLLETEDIYHPLAWTAQEAHRLLKDVSVLEEHRLVLRVPNWWRKKARPQVSVTIGSTSVSQVGTKGLLDFSLSGVLGDEKLTPAEWQEILASDGGIVRIKGQWVEADAKRLQETLAHWEQVQQEVAAGGIGFIEGMRLLAGASHSLDGNSSVEETCADWSQVQAGPWLQEQLQQLSDPSSVAGQRDLAISADLQADLRPYQEDGHRWLLMLTRLGLGACLADDMGLGKTMQVISVMLAHKQQQAQAQIHTPSLLVLPASLLNNWTAEITRFAPSLRVCSLHTAQMKKAEMLEIEHQCAEYDVIITTYGMISRIPWLQTYTWNMLILDEAQAIKNAGTRQTKAVKSMQAQSRIALTGTPVENRLGDLWSLFDFLCPGLLGGATRFKRFIKQLESRSHDHYAPLRQLIQPYILRRLKTDKSIISDLPDKIEVNAYCGLTKPQAAVYAHTVQALEKDLAEQEGASIKRRGLVLSYLTRFKQICNHPDQYSGTGGAYAESASGKFLRLRVLAEEIAQRQEKLLIFTQYKEMCAPLHDFLTTIFGVDGLVLHGGTAIGKRQKMVDRFQSEQNTDAPFFVLSLKAGGTGLNLTAANHVIHFDRWWNPAVENQATDRAYRIGQHRNVLVHKFVCTGTIEEKIDRMIQDKNALADDLLQGSSESVLTEMSDSELLKMVSLDIKRAAV